ncbi:MAG: hypothetical protein V4642_10535 [Bacteroidota bacterium]
MAIVLIGCGDDNDEKELLPLKIAKIKYSGNELRTDGYYYSTPRQSGTISIAVFYKDGVCLHSLAEPTSQDTFYFIENEILGDKALISRYWNTPDQIGVFQIDDKSLQFEKWNNDYHQISSLSFFCDILNDTTFVQTKWVNNSSRMTYPERLTYHFKQFSPKPDSTNKFIK